MNLNDIVGTAKRKIRPPKKHNTRSAIIVTAGLASAVWAAIKLKRELYGPGGTKLSRYRRSVDKPRQHDD